MIKSEKGLLNEAGFDQWAMSYDQSIDSDEVGYPFEGYFDVLSYIQKSVHVDRNTSILDLGIGTGLLTTYFYKQGASIFGLDFSKQMIHEASKKMPHATLIYHDLNDALPKEILKQKYDYILSSYALHHVDDQRKLDLIQQLISCLKPTGKMLFGDISFETNEQLDHVKQTTTRWDEDEFYMVASSFVTKLKSVGVHAEYVQISVCGGVLKVYM